MAPYKETLQNLNEAEILKMAAPFMK